MFAPFISLDPKRCEIWKGWRLRYVWYRWELHDAPLWYQLKGACREITLHPGRSRDQTETRDTFIVCFYCLFLVFSYDHRCAVGVRQAPQGQTPPCIIHQLTSIALKWRLAPNQHNFWTHQSYLKEVRRVRLQTLPGTPLPLTISPHFWYNFDYGWNPLKYSFHQFLTLFHLEALTIHYSRHPD